MKRLQYGTKSLLMIWMSAVAVLSLSLSASPVPGPLLDPLPGIPVHDLDFYEDTVRAAWQRVLTEPDWKLDEWASSSDPKSVSVAIYVMRARRDVTRLAAMSPSLDSTMAGLPTMNLVKAEYNWRRTGPEYVLEAEDNIASQLRKAYSHWFNIEVRSKAEYDEVMAGVSDVNALGWPRVRRLERAILRGAPESELEPLRAAIRALPEARRWGVVSLARAEGFFSEAEGKALLAGLTNTTRAAILGPEPMQADEPCLTARPRQRGASHLERARAEARWLVVP